MSIIDKEFYYQKTEVLARSLLGKILVRDLGGSRLSGMIVETEAYVGPHDLACHASKGKTKRTSVMYNKGGIWYVYMIYGMYYCLNIVSEKEDYPAAVLIRALEPLEGVKVMKKNRKKDDLKDLCSGPGKLSQALSIDISINNSSATDQDALLYIEKGDFVVSDRDVVMSKRIGVDYAGEWKDKLLRFYLRNNKHISKS